MEGKELRSYEMVLCVRTYLAEVAASFPAGSLGAELATRINTSMSVRPCGERGLIPVRCKRLVWLQRTPVRGPAQRHYSSKMTS